MSNLVRVQLDNGSKTTVSAEYADILGVAVLDEPAVDERGVALAEEHPGSTEFDVETADKAELEAEIARRNAGRDDEHQIVVEGRGNKPDLIAAVKADNTTSGSVAASTQEETE